MGELMATILRFLFTAPEGARRADICRATGLPTREVRHGIDALKRRKLIVHARGRKGDPWAVAHLGRKPEAVIAELLGGSR